MWHTRSKTLVIHLVAIPVATLVAVFVYLQHPQITSATSVLAPIPMLISLWIAQISCALFLVFHPTPHNENQLSVTLISLFVSLILSTFLIFAFRLHYSLSFLIIYHGLTWLWTIWIHNRTVRHIGNARFLIAKLGRWHVLGRDAQERVQLIDSATELFQKPGETLVVDVAADNLKDWARITSRALSSGSEVITLDQFHELTTGRVLLPNSPTHVVATLSEKNWYFVFKRLADLAISGLLLLITLPLMVVCLLLIRLESPGNPLYAQTRIGRYGKQFRLYKLRTMQAEAEQDGPQFTSRKDPRITKLGRFLRRTKLDECPQFFNVLQGDMSLVGPRPERPEWVTRFKRELPSYELRHVIRPGITGWAQITEGYAETLTDTNLKLQRDLFYIRYLSLSLDLAIIFRTIPVIGRGFTLGAGQ